MNPPIDSSSFPTGAPEVDYESDKEREALALLEDEALALVESLRWAPPVRELVLAFGVAPIAALYLVRFTTAITSGECRGDNEAWVVVGDFPGACFEADMRTPADALRLYCAIGQDWAENVLGNRDLTESYPLPANPTRENAKMLLGRVEFIRDKLIPLA